MRISVLCLFLCSFILTACTGSEREVSRENSLQETGKSDMTDQMIDVTLTIGEQVFSAKLYDHQTTRAFIEKLPLSINMNDHNRNEKFYNFPNSLPEDSERPGEIRAGDIMLYGDNCLVLFYESFSSTYHYTRMGFIEDAAGFAQAAGAGDITVDFDQAENRK